MPFSEDRFEEYAMQAEATAQGTVAKTGKWFVDVDEVGTALGMSSHDSRLFAYLLEKAGWAELFHQDGGESPKLRLTLEGFRAIAKLREPPWQRWFDKHPKTTAAIVAAASAVLVALLAEFLKKVLW